MLSQKNKLYDFDPAKNKQILIGQVVGSAIVIKKTNRHYMRVVGGYGIQESAFKELERNNIEEIRIHNTDTNERWKADIETWRLKSKTANYGHGRQVFLSTSYMRPYEVQTQYPTEEERAEK